MKKDKYVGICKVGEKGQIVIPKDARDMFNIKPGDSIIVLCDKEKGIALVKSDVIENIGDDILEENNKIINNSIDLIPIIWQNIILEVPLKVVSPDIEVKNINGDGWRFITDEEVVEKEIDPRLEKLKEFLGE